MLNKKLSFKHTRIHKIILNNNKIWTSLLYEDSLFAVTSCNNYVSLTNLVIFK